MEKEDFANKLWHDYLELCESYQDNLNVPEFGFLLISMVSKMLFDCACDKETAIETMVRGIRNGERVSDGQIKQLEK